MDGLSNPKLRLNPRARKLHKLSAADAETAAQKLPAKMAVAHSEQSVGLDMSLSYLVDGVVG